MSVPPKSDEDTSKSTDSTSEPTRAKRRPRARSRHYKTTKASKTVDSDSPATEAAPSERAPEPAMVHESPREPAQESPPTPVAESAPSEPTASARSDSQGESESRGESDPRDAAEPRSPQQSGDEGGNGGGGNGGYYQQQQQHGKFGRRHRGKQFNRGNAKWVNPNVAPKHPQQPPPPSAIVHYGDLPDPARFQDFAALESLASEVGTSNAQPIWLHELYKLNHAELVAKAKELGTTFEGVPNRKQLLAGIFKAVSEQKIPLYDQGWLDVTDKGHGFVVHEAVNYRLYPEDAFLPEIFVRKFGLRRGHHMEVQLQPPQGNDRCPSVISVRTVMGGKPEDISKVKPFEELTPYYPLQRIMLERPDQKDVSMRMVDIVTPVGFGQRGLIVAPPRTGKTILMQNMANSIAVNSPDSKLIILLVDERPEEVTDFRRHCKGEVVSSTFDEMPESHIHCAEMVIEKARRLVEMGQHVIILLDSITRLARAYNALASNSGKIMSGGLEATALQKPKRFFGSARNIEGAGSLTILGTALVDTGSRMDEIIFEEFKGTGNMELHLDRDLVNKRIFPAVNIDKSGTRKEELIYHPDELLRIYALRRAMQGVPAADSMDMLISRLKKTKTNAEFLMSLNR